MTDTQRDDLVEGKATEANYDRWHAKVDDEPTQTKPTFSEARTIAEIMGTDDGDQ